MSTTKKNTGKALSRITFDLEECLKAYLKASPSSQVGQYLFHVGVLPTAYSLSRGIISKLTASHEPVTFGALVGSVKQELELEHRMAQRTEGDGDPIHVHFKRSPGEPIWHTIQRLEQYTEDPEDLTKVAMCLTECFLRRYEGLLIHQRLAWRNHQSKRMVSLTDNTYRALLQDTPIPPRLTLVKLEELHQPYLKEGRFGIPRIVPSNELPLGWNDYRLDPKFFPEAEKLLKGEPNLFFTDTEEIRVPPNGSKLLNAFLRREEATRRSREYAAKQAARAYLKWGDKPFSYPITTDFRGRMYLSAAGSPTELKEIRPWLLAYDGQPFEYFDMRQSSLNILSILSQGKALDIDVYQAISDSIGSQWSGILEKAFGPCSRDLVKGWYKARVFGQTKRQAYHQAIGGAVKNTSQWDDRLRQEIKRVFELGWEELSPYIPQVFSLQPGEQPYVILPDDYKVSLGYYRQPPRKLISRFRGHKAKRFDDFVYMTERQDSRENISVGKTKRGLTANLVHSLDALILRDLMWESIPMVPIHDCFGLCPGTNTERILEIVRDAIKDFMSISNFVGVDTRFTSDVKLQGLTFEALYEKE